MPIRALVTVAGVDLPEPSTYSGVVSTLVNNARNSQGVMIGAVIRDNIAKVELTWKYLTVEQWSLINQLFNQSGTGHFINSVTFFDQVSGSYVTRNMYINDRNAGMWRRNPSTGDVMGWTNCKLNLIEV